MEVEVKMDEDMREAQETQEDGWIKAQSGDWYQFDRKGEVLEGVLVDKRSIPGKYGEQFVIDVERSPGDVVPLGCTTVLRNKLKVVNVGEIVKITFLGMRKAKSGSEYKDFEVLYKKP